MKKVAIVTATRAEYGLLMPVIRELRKYESDTFKAELIVTGTHLSDQYGMTVQEIAAEWNYSWRHIQRMKVDALKEFAEKYGES